MLKTDIRSRNTVNLRKKLVRSVTVGKSSNAPKTYKEKRLREKELEKERENRNKDLPKIN